MGATKDGRFWTKCRLVSQENVPCDAADMRCHCVLSNLELEHEAQTEFNNDFVLLNNGYSVSLILLEVALVQMPMSYAMVKSHLGT